MSTAAQPYLLAAPKIRRVLAVDDPSLREFMVHAEFSAEFELVKSTLESFLNVAFRERFDLIITSPRKTVEQDIELLQCLQRWRGDGVEVIILAPRRRRRKSAARCARMHFGSSAFHSITERSQRSWRPPSASQFGKMASKSSPLSLTGRSAGALQYGGRRTAAAVRLSAQNRHSQSGKRNDFAFISGTADHCHGARRPFQSSAESRRRLPAHERHDLYYLRDPGGGFDSVKAIADAKAAAMILPNLGEHEGHKGNLKTTAHTDLPEFR